MNRRTIFPGNLAESYRYNIPGFFLLHFRFFACTLWLVLLISPNVYSQQGNYPLNHTFNIAIDEVITKNKIPVHSGFRPLLKSQLMRYADFDSVAYIHGRDSVFLSKRKHTWFWRRLRTDDFLVVDTADFHLNINPLFDFSYGKNLLTDSILSINTRGVIIGGDIGKKFSFQSAFLENQGFYDDYIDEAVAANFIMHGQGRVKTFKATGWDFSSASGYISYSPSQHFNMQLGHDKNFVGEGYRSLLLSDNAYYYPFVKFTTTFSRIQYINMLTSFQDISRYDGPYNAYHRKHGSFTYLNWLMNKRIQIGLFEGIIWQTSDSTYNNRFDINYFDPVILVRSFQYSLNSNHNILLGLTGKCIVTRSILLYGQLAVDDLDLREPAGYFDNKFGYQTGVKFFDLFTLNNWYLQVEYNQAKPYMYSHSVALQGYSNMWQPLAHPLGANFRELIGITRYSFKDFFIELKYNYAVTGADTNKSDYGANIFLSNEKSSTGTYSENNPIGQGIRTTIENASGRFGILVNPRTNLFLFVDLNYRRYVNSITTAESKCIMFGIKTSLNNHYFDF